MDINNKVAIITGGIGGIGFATIKNLLQSGIDFVAIFDIHKTEDEVVRQKLEELQKKYKNDKYGYYTCDLTNISELTTCYEKVLALKTYVDIFINNAGVACDKNIDLIIDVNFRAVIHGTMIAIERMDKRKNYKGGVVVNVASNLGLTNIPELPLYCATKHAVVSFVRAMKEHNKTFGVRIVSVCPGATKTSIVSADNLRNGVFEFVNPEQVDKIQLTKFQSPDNVASAIIEIIKRGKEGEVWVSQRDELPFNFNYQEPDL